MNNNKKKKLSIINLCVGYLLGFVFIWLMLINIDNVEDKEANVILSRPKLDPEVIEVNKTEIVYVDRFVDRPVRGVEYFDHLDGVILSPEKNRTLVYGQRDLIIEDDIVYNNVGTHEKIHSTVRGDIINERSGIIHNRVGDHHHDHGVNVDASSRPLLRDKDFIKSEERLLSFEEATKKDELIGLNKEDEGFSSNLSPVRGEPELGDIEGEFGENKGDKLGAGKGGQLYAYNFPTQGVGAGVGSGGLRAAGGSGAGLGAGIGEGLLNGETVPTLGGVGDGAKSMYGEPAEPAGVGGLVGGAGAGGAAGLTQGYITEKLGIGAGPGAGTGGNGGYGRNYDHLPENGALHIMMHVDGSGSILNTRKKLEIMKDTLFKKALLPYYGNDESLYNKRVTIVDSSGERTLKFFNKATEKDNVLAIVFQDEAQPDYHLPNFNKGPEGHYKEDLNKLKSNLNGRKGIYRGIMFQVGEKNFSRSFKEFVENAWQGQGYLKSDNLKKYYWQDNKSNIKNKEGVVFSDEYHTRTEGDPQYYMNLIFDAAKKIGIDLNSYEAGLTDGKKVHK